MAVCVYVDQQYQYMHKMCCCCAKHRSSCSSSYYYYYYIYHGIVTELQGQAFGPEPGSFRAEAYGMLAGLRLILQACQLWNIQLQADIQIFCDNEGLIKRMHKRKELKGISLARIQA